MNPDAEFNAAIERNTDVALDHCVLNLDGATTGSTALRNSTRGALNYAPAVNGDRGVDQIAA
jgi:hypothetical protein